MLSNRLLQKFLLFRIVGQWLHVVVNPLEHASSLILRLQQTNESFHVVFVVSVEFNLNIDESVFVRLLLD